jgi:endoglucanase
MMEPDDRKKVAKMEDLWIDIGAKDHDEAASLVAIGDPAVLDYGMAELRNGLVAGRGFDDRIGAFVALEAARLLSEMNPKAAVYAVATVQEEIGARGAVTSGYGIDPQVAIAIDVSHTTDTPSMTAYKKRIGVNEMGKGPIITRGANINPKLFTQLVEAGKKHKIPYQIHAFPRGTGTDGNTLQLVRGGVATAVLGIPNRYMHSPSEIVHLGDVENCARLIAQTVVEMDETTDFTPS